MIEQISITAITVLLSALSTYVIAKLMIRHTLSNVAWDCLDGFMRELADNPTRQQQFQALITAIGAGIGKSAVQGGMQKMPKMKDALALAIMGAAQKYLGIPLFGNEAQPQEQQQQNGWTQ